MRKSIPYILLLLLVVFVVSLANEPRALTNSATAEEVSPAVAQTNTFSSFKAKVETEPSELELTTLLTLGPQSKGINPLTDVVGFKVGDYMATIPANSFKATSIGWFKYEGVINGRDVEVRIFPLGSNRYVLRAEVAGKGLEQPVPGPVKVEVSIGNDTGSATVKVRRGWI